MATLYGNPENFRVQKVLIAAKLANKNVKTVPKEPPAKNFPLGLAPAFEDGNVHLFGAEPIAKYLLGPDSQYLPENPELDQWIYWAEGSLLPNVLSYVLPSVFAAKVDQKNVEQAKRELLAQLQQLNNVLVQKDFLVSDCLSMADVSVAVNLLPAYQHVLDTEARKQIGNVNRWFQTVLRNPDVKSVVGELKFINEPSKLDDKDNKIADAVPNDGKKEAAAGADDFDLFGSDEEQEDEEKKKVTEARLKAYAEKKSKKPGPIAKSNVIYDIKPWDDTIDIKEIESNVRTIASDGLVWGTSKVLPVAFGINKLQICCCVEDDKVSTDWLEEQITSFEDLVQSVDVVAFNKV